MKKNINYLLIPFTFFLLFSRLSAQDCLTFYAGTEAVAPGESVCIEVSATGFTDIVSLQYSLHYDPAVLQFSGIQDFNLPSLSASNFGMPPNTDDGTITFSWLDFNVQGVSVADGTSLFSVCFNATGADGSLSAFSIDGNPTPVEVTTGDLNIVPASLVNGLIGIGHSNTQLPYIDAACASSAICGEGGSINLVLADGTTPYTFVWQGPDGFSSSEQNITNLSPGFYSVTASDAAGLQISASFTIEEQGYPSYSFDIENTQCTNTGGSIDLTVDAAPDSYSVLWSNGATTEDLINLAPGTYEVTISLTGTTCTLTDSVTIIYEFLVGTAYECTVFTDPPGVVADLSVAVWCGGVPPYTFEWSTGEITQDTLISTISVSNPDSAYSVTITDAEGEQYVQTGIEADCGDVAACDNDTTPPLASCNSSLTASLGMDGTLTIWPQDINESSYDDCTSSDNLTLRITLENSQTPPATQYLVFDQVGTYYPILWVGDEAGNWTQCFTMLDVIDLGCNNDTVPPVAICNALIQMRLDCDTDNATVYPHIINEGSYDLCSTQEQLDFRVELGTPSPDTPPATTEVLLTEAGYYDVTLWVGDASGNWNACFAAIEVEECISTDSLELSATLTDPSCDEANGSISINVTGGSGNYTYLWSTGATTMSISGLVPGTYSVTVADTDSGASVSGSYELTAEQLVIASSYECQYLGDDEWQATIYVLSWNGTAPFTFDWSTGVTTTSDEAIGELVAGSGLYSVTVTDANGCTADMEIDVLCGDVAPPVQISLEPEQSNLNEGDNVCLDVTVENYQDILTTQFSVNWDENLLQLDSITNLNLPEITLSHFGIFSNEATVAWNVSTSSGVSLPDGSAIFSLCFTVVGEDEICNIDITGDPTPIEIVTADFQEQDVVVNGASITIGDISSDAVFSFSTETGAPGDTVCLAITASGLVDVVGMQFSINWDPSALLFIGVENYIVDGSPISTVFSPTDTAALYGQSTFLWVDSGLQGHDWSDDSLLFELCFEVVGGDGFSEVTVSDIPNIIEIVDVNNNVFSAQTIPGGVLIVDERVWPGDTDDNETANHYDLLHIGLAFGATGPERVNANLDWQGQIAPEWLQATPESNVDFKHIDTDGNGVINVMDTLALSQNWGQTTSLWEETDDPFKPGNKVQALAAPLFIVADTVNVGDMASFDIVLGTTDFPAENTYGIAFSLLYDADFVVDGSAGVDFINSWLGTLESDMIGMYRDFPGEGRIEVAMTRIDGQEMSGYGVIGQFNLTIEDVIFKSNLRELNVDIKNPRIITYSELEIPVDPQPIEILVNTTTRNQEPDISAFIKIYPVPASDFLKIEASGYDVESIRVFNMQGQMAAYHEGVNNISVSKLQAGNYILKIITNEGLAIKPLVIVR